MTPRTIFLILLKIVGLYFLKQTLVCAYETILFAVTVASATPTNGSTGSISTDYYGWVSFVAIFVGYLLLSLFFLFKTHWIVDLLKLDRGFDK